MKKKILIICQSDFKNEPRVIKQIKALKDHYELVYAGPEALDQEVQFVRIQQNCIHHNFLRHYPFLIRKIVSFFLKILFIFEKVQDKTFKKLNKIDFDLLIAHHLTSLSLASRLAVCKQSKLLFNAHEYYPLEFEDRDDWVKNTQTVYVNLCQKYLTKIDGMFSVSEGIADKYEEEFGIKSEVVLNTRDYCNLKPSVTSESKIKLIHHGAAMPSRRIEQMMEMMNFLDDRFTLDLMLMRTDEKYYNFLVQKAKDNSRIHFIEPVSSEEVPSRTNHYDIGVHLLPPINFNHQHALPNKLFDFIQARLAIAIGPSPGMASLVQKYNLGVISDDFSPLSLAKKLNVLTSQEIMYYKNQCDQFAHELSSEKTMEVIRNSVEKLLSAQR